MDEVNEGGTVNFDAGDSFDDGDIVSYEWDFGDGSTGSGQTVSHVFESEGGYDVVLTVTDDQGKQDRVRLHVPYTAASVANPAALCSARRRRRGRWSVLVDGSASMDPEPRWSAGLDFDASNGTGVEPRRPPGALQFPGSYGDAHGYDVVGLSSATTTVTVSAGTAGRGADGLALVDDTFSRLLTARYDLNGLADDAGSAAIPSIGRRYLHAPAGDEDSFDDEISPRADRPDRRHLVGGRRQVQQTDTAGVWRYFGLGASYRDFQLEVDFKAVRTGTDPLRAVNTAGTTKAFYSGHLNYWRFYDWQTNTTLRTRHGMEPRNLHHLRLVVVGPT
jgi:hypothetical protein